MSTYGSIAGKVNALIATIAAVCILLFTGYSAWRDYQYQRDAVFVQASGLVRGNALLPLNLYFRDELQLRKALEGISKLSPAVKRVVFYDGNGALIGETHKNWVGSEASTARFTTLREGLSPLDEARVSLPEEHGPKELKALELLTLGERSLSVTVPVTSTLNTTREDLQRDDFAQALTSLEEVQSLHVVGYAETSISSTVLWTQTLPTIAQTLALGAGVAILLWFLARIMTRQINAPLAALARQADAMAAGNHKEALNVASSGEVGEIANTLTGIISDMQDHRQRVDMDRKLLSLTVDERTEQLSKHQLQLSEAEEKVSQTKSQLQHLAYFDTLTSLPNRRLFLEQLTLLLRLAARNNQKLGLLLIDIDNFKRINKSLGATGGDQLLKEVAQRLTNCVRDSDVLHRSTNDEAGIMDLSRMGGDEFTVVLNQIDDAETALRTAKRLSEAVRQPYLVDEQEVVISSSIGLALAPTHAQDAEGLLRAADSAMMQAKGGERNGITLFNPSMQGDGRQRLQLENDLRKALESNELILHYQPQVHAISGAVSGVEALVRWRHPEKGLIPPYQWIPIAEELGLIHDVGAWVLREACTTLVRLREDGMCLPRISVNVSALQLRDSFVSEVETTLKESGLDPASLKLELTEGIMINSHEPTLKLVERLRELNVQLSIDDFGTGYSSLSYLARFPLNELKIDRSFVQGLAQGDNNAELVRAIIAMARSLSLDIVVEGVEHIEELQFFREQNVDVIQGYLFSPPIPEEQLREMLCDEYFRKHLHDLGQSGDLSEGRPEGRSEDRSEERPEGQSKSKLIESDPDIELA